MYKNMANLEEYFLRDHLNMYWLRPESALWDAIAGRLIGDELLHSDSILELGIGNGFFSFLMLGGKFKPEFDWFYSVNPEGFWKNEDVFDHDAGIDYSKFIDKYPTKRLHIGLDHKPNLLAQVKRLGFVDELVVHDGNQPIALTGFDAIYSNIIYWLKNPLAVVRHFCDLLPSNGRCILVFPNSSFFEHCTSYTNNAPLWKLVNRGRAAHIMWHMDMDEFRSFVEKETDFRVANSCRYLSPLTLKIWDVGVRPLSMVLTKMANKLTPEDRLEIKNEWCETAMLFLNPLLEQELESGADNGGYNFVVLEKK